MKKLLNSKIEVGKKVNEVRELVKNYNKEKQDMYDYTEKLFKPSIKAQKDIKKSIDDKQDELINQIQINDELANMKQNQVIAKLQRNNNRQDEIITNIQENQKALKKGFSDLIEPYQREIIFRDELPKMIEDKGSDEDLIQLGDDEDLIQLGDDEDLIQLGDDKADEVEASTSKKKIKSLNIDKGIDDDYITFLDGKQLPLPSKVLNENMDTDNIKKQVVSKYNYSLKYITENSTKKGEPLKKLKPSQLNIFKKHKKSLEYFDDYFKRLQNIEDSKKYVGEGIYTQKKRNAYKISQNGQYGGLVIDLPKLYGHLKVVAHKNGRKVYDKQADFDTLDLLTKRFNNKKKYSELARSVFNDLNRLSEIPIHRTSKKYSKLGSGVVYYHNPQDLLSRLELLGGSMSAGNDSNDVREEFVNIAHMLNKLKVINNKQMNDIIKNYLL